MLITNCLFSVIYQQLQFPNGSEHRKINITATNNPEICKKKKKSSALSTLLSRIGHSDIQQQGKNK